MMKELLIKLMTTVHLVVLRLSKGRLGASFGNAPVLLLTVQGRTSGRPRTVPLLYLRDGLRYIVIASKGGVPTHPDWYLNLEAKPGASIQIGDQIIQVTSETVAGDERERLWKEAVKIYAAYDDYARQTTRVIPVVALTPSADPLLSTEMK
ncbi:MAG: nitroreductase family deazaflavin-dependent oxidoreductase [Chloroflexota bacterium]